MIYANCRASTLGGLRYASRVTWKADRPDEHVATDLTGKRVVVLVHGVKNTTAQIENAYREIFNRNRAAYDVAVGFIYPGGVSPFAWPVVSLEAVDEAAYHLSEVLATVQKLHPLSIDIDAHSLGCPIALEALCERENTKIDGLWLMAPAMGRDLSDYRELLVVDPHLLTGPQIRYDIHVFRSRRDPVLAFLYRIWPLKFGRAALGAAGESSKGGNIAIDHDCTAEVGMNHTGYRRSNIVVQAHTNEAIRRARAAGVPFSEKPT